MRVLRDLAGTSVKAAAAAVDAIQRPTPGFVVLIYHRVGQETDSAVDLPLELFRRQMEWIAGTGRVRTLDEALDTLSGDAPPAVDPIVVTFDDGTADFVDIVTPILVGYHVPALLYLATEFVEKQADFPHGARPLAWSGLQDAIATGLVTVGSHTHTHRLLDRLDVTEVADDLDRSIELIGERLGVTADHFAHPKAVAGSPGAETAIRQRFRSAALAGTRANPYAGTDAWRLARSPIQVSDGMRWFQRKASGGMALEDRLRRAANRHRYATATR